MAVIVYKDGKQDKVEPQFLQGALDAGWSLTREPAEDPKEKPAEDSEKLENYRAIAKELGLKPHHRAGIEKIKEMIEEAQRDNDQD